MKWLFLLGILVTTSAYSQVISVDAGTSSLIRGSGVGATLYLPSSVVYMAVGYGQGKVQYSLSDTFKWKEDLVTVGSRQIGFGFNGIGLGLNINGISVSRKRDKWEGVIFGGAVGTTGYSAPFLLSGASNQHIGGGIFVTRKIGKDLKLYTLDAFNGGQKTATFGASYNYHRTLSFSGAGGWVNNSEILDGTISYRPITNLNLYASREDFFSPYRATGNNVGGAFSYDRYNVSASLNQSVSAGKTVVGESLNGGVKIGFLQEQIGYYKSGTRTLINSNTTEKIGHFNLSQSVSESMGQLSYAMGGGYTSRGLSLSVTHSIAFLVSGEGWEQVTGVSLSIRLPHDTTANFSTVTTPFGKTLYLADTTTYEGLGGALEGQIVSHPIGKYLISGTCKDDKGLAIFGCAIKVGDSIAYSDNRGEWFARVKSPKSQALEVIPEVFANPGNWEVVTAPHVAPPGASVEIVVKRTQGVTVTKPTDVPLSGAVTLHKSFLKRVWDAMRGRSDQ